MTKLEELASQLAETARRLKEEANAISISDLNDDRTLTVNILSDNFFAMFPKGTVKIEASKRGLQYPYTAKIKMGGITFFTMLTTEDIKCLGVEVA